MKRRAAGILAVWAAAAVAAAGTARAAAPASPFDEPPAKPPEAKAPAAKPAPVRTIRGTLTPPDRVLSAFLWERASDTKVPVKVDPRTGAFEAPNLRMGTWDLVLLTPWGRLEGVDMGPKLSEYDALIPEEYRTEDLGLEAGGAVSEEDAKAIRRHVYDVKRHENRIRDLALRGTGDKAVALMELALDRDFVGRKGDEITWRIEQWYYEKKYDAWLPFRTRVLYRYRVSKAAWQTWGWQFEPALGGFNVTADLKEPITVRYVVPEKPAAEKGLAGNRPPPVQDAPPTVNEPETGGE